MLGLLAFACSSSPSADLSQADAASTGLPRVDAASDARSRIAVEASVAPYPTWADAGTSSMPRDAGAVSRDGGVPESGLRATAPQLDAGTSTQMDAATPLDGDGPGTTDAGAPPAVRYVGRFDTSHPAGPQVDWSDARVLVRFAGTGAAVTMTDTSYGGGNAYWDVTVDGALAASPLALTEGKASYSLAEGLVSGVHTIELWKRTEANVSLTEIDGFAFGDGTLLPPAPAPSRRIEFLGDSVSAGFGDLGTDPSCVFSPATENSHLGFPALVATAFGADHQNLAYSGYGVYWSYDREGPVFASVYPRTLATVPGSTWSFASFEPDVVWITLGGNDWDQPDPGDPPPALGDFEAAYDSLVETVRAEHPNAYIVCAIAPSLNDSYPSVPPYDALSNMETALLWEVAQHPSDQKLSYFEFARATAAELSGCGSHPGVAEQSSLAEQAIMVIASLTGWTATAWTAE